jgi:hypothetical protein
MYHKIVNHYRQYLNNLKQNNHGTGSNSATTENSQATTNSPIPGPSHQQDEEPSSENFEPVPGPSHREDEMVSIPKETEKLTHFSPSFSAVKVFENNEIEVFVQKSLHKRLKRFKMQDNLFNVKVKIKNNSSPPLIKDLLMVLDKAFNFILANIKTFFKDDEENIVYMTLIQSPMVNGLNSAGFHLQDNSSSEMIDQILNMLQRFLISDNNINLEINDTFKVYVHVLSVDHVEFKRRHPRAKQKNSRKKHYGAQNSKNSLKYIWAIDVPNGYDNNLNVFENKCLLISIILGHLQNEYFKSERKDKRFFYAKKINNKNKHDRIYAGNILKTEMNYVLSELNLTATQSFMLEDLCIKMSDFYKCQIFLFDGIENSSKLKFIYPPTLQDNLEPIYLYEPFENEHHVIFIKNINSYFKANKKVCFQCKKTFKDSRYLHRCIRKFTCFACRRRFKNATSYSHEKLEPHYCDVKVNQCSQNSLCPICNVSLLTNHCKKGHKLLCNGKGSFGWKCLKCKRFTPRYQNLSSEQLKMKHKCGEHICVHCKQYYNPKENEEIHLCPLRKETVSDKWPSLAFMRFEFVNYNSENCAQCYEIKQNFQKENNMNLKEIYEHEKFPELFCDVHLQVEKDLDCNLIVIYKEDKVKRGQFTRHILSNFCVNEDEQKTLSFDYLEDLKAPSCFIQKKNILSLDLRKRLEQLQNQSADKSLVLKFFALIFSDEWSNTTFLVQDEDSICLVCLRIYHC